MQAGPAPNSQCGFGSCLSAWAGGWAQEFACGLPSTHFSKAAPNPCCNRLGCLAIEPVWSGLPWVSPWYPLATIPSLGPTEISTQLTCDISKVKFMSCCQLAALTLWSPTSSPSVQPSLTSLSINLLPPAFAMWFTLPGAPSALLNLRATPTLDPSLKSFLGWHFQVSHFFYFFRGGLWEPRLGSTL